MTDATSASKHIQKREKANMETFFSGSREHLELRMKCLEIASRHPYEGTDGLITTAERCWTFLVTGMPMLTKVEQPQNGAPSEKA